MLDILVKRDDVLKLLVDENILMGYELIKTRKPTHGTCCTCQNCGEGYDDCICDHNEVLGKLLNLDVYND